MFGGTVFGQESHNDTFLHFILDFYSTTFERLNSAQKGKGFINVSKDSLNSLKVGPCPLRP